MSHRAVDWAMNQRGLRPSEKLTLLFLADCYSVLGGCAPTQAYLTSMTEMNRGSLNRVLRSLEDRGLIRRFVRRDAASGRSMPTSYELALELPEHLNPPPVAAKAHYISAVTREAVYARDGSTCAYCGAHLVGTDRCLDHVVPRSRGGSDDPGNLVTACRTCNSAKGSLSLSEFLFQRRAAT